MKPPATLMTFEVRPAMAVSGSCLQTFRCPSCGNEGAVVSNCRSLALYCTQCVAEDNVTHRLQLNPVIVEVRS